MNSPVINWRKTKKLHNFLGKKGKLIVWTKIFVAPSGFEHEAPYYSGIVEWEDGIRQSLQIVEVEENDLKVGALVKAVVRKLGKGGPDEVINYTIKAKLI